MSYSGPGLDGASVLVTGGTGSFGKAFVATVLERYPDVARLVVYSRDELKQYEMSQIFCEERYPAMRYFIGDVRDQARLARAMEGVDVVVHAAALKHVPVCEYNPFEAIKTNVMGAQNVIETAINANVQRVVALSTDKAAAPINLYGATKLCSDKLFVAANNYRGSRDIRFSVVRYGNVMGSRGSVIPFFLGKRHEGMLPVTDERMTRFNITLQEGVDMVLDAIDNQWGGELYVPRIPSYRITDVAEAIAPGAELEIVGIRPGEKLHEEMITETDSSSTVELPDKYVILPSMSAWDSDDFIGAYGGKMCDSGFRYSSGDNDQWLTVEEIRALIRRHVDPTFSV
jgi:UDP-N-acetylglucosamine 4,6-dehydratase (inverting)